MTAQRIKKPVIAGSWYPGAPRTLREEIELFFSRKVPIVGSSDLSRYHAYEKAVVMERRALDDLVRMDAAGLLGDLEAGLSEACGGGGGSRYRHGGPKTRRRKGRTFEIRQLGGCDGR